MELPYSPSFEHSSVDLVWFLNQRTRSKRCVSFRFRKKEIICVRWTHTNVDLPVCNRSPYNITVDDWQLRCNYAWFFLFIFCFECKNCNPYTACNPCIQLICVTLGVCCCVVFCSTSRHAVSYKLHRKHIPISTVSNANANATNAITEGSSETVAKVKCIRNAHAAATHYVWHMCVRFKLNLFFRCWGCFRWVELGSVDDNRQQRGEWEKRKQ